MAIRKEIRHENGIITNYHRIGFVMNSINSHNSIAVFSYVDQVSRATEINGIEPYKVSVTYEKEYEEDMTVERAYQYIKSLPQFEGAEDV